MNKINAVELKKIRTDNNLTQIDMAIMCNVSLSSFRLWERGAQNPNEYNIEKLNSALKELKEKKKKK